MPIRRSLVLGIAFSLSTTFNATVLNASEVCEWTADKSMELYDLKVESNFPEFALKRFSEAFVDTERNEGFLEKSFHKGVLEGYVEVLFDPEMSFLIDGTLDRNAVRDIFYESCMEVMD